MKGKHEKWEGGSKEKIHIVKIIEEKTYKNVLFFVNFK